MSYVYLYMPQSCFSHNLKSHLLDHPSPKRLTHDAGCQFSSRTGSCTTTARQCLTDFANSCSCAPRQKKTRQRVIGGHRTCVPTIGYVLRSRIPVCTAHVGLQSVKLQRWSLCCVEDARSHSALLPGLFFARVWLDQAQIKSTHNL